MLYFKGNAVRCSAESGIEDRDANVDDPQLFALKVLKKKFIIESGNVNRAGGTMHRLPLCTNQSLAVFHYH